MQQLQNINPNLNSISTPASSQPRRPTPPPLNSNPSHGSIGHHASFASSIIEGGASAPYTQPGSGPTSASHRSGDHYSDAFLSILASAGHGAGGRSYDHPNRYLDSRESVRDLPMALGLEWPKSNSNPVAAALEAHMSAQRLDSQTPTSTSSAGQNGSPPARLLRTLSGAPSRPSNSVDQRNHTGTGSELDNRDSSTWLDILSSLGVVGPNGGHTDQSMPTPRGPHHVNPPVEDIFPWDTPIHQLSAQSSTSQVSSSKHSPPQLPPPPLASHKRQRSADDDESRGSPTQLDNQSGERGSGPRQADASKSASGGTASDGSEDENGNKRRRAP